MGCCIRARLEPEETVGATVEKAILYPYTGAYEVDPSNKAQTLPTSGKCMTRDVTVNAVPKDYSSNWTLIASETFSVKTTSTTASTVGNVYANESVFTKDDVIWVRVRDIEGKRSGYFYGSDAIFINSSAANGTASFTVPTVCCIRVNADGTYTSYAGSYGVYGYSVGSGTSGTIQIRRRYNSSYSLTIDSEYVVEVYRLTLPNTVKLFD